MPRWHSPVMSLFKKPQDSKNAVAYLAESF